LEGVAEFGSAGKTRSILDGSTHV